MGARILRRIRVFGLGQKFGMDREPLKWQAAIQAGGVRQRFGQHATAAQGSALRRVSRTTGLCRSAKVSTPAAWRVKTRRELEFEGALEPRKRERMFGQADLDGVIGVHGAPRWKQRAMYDVVKDAAAAAGQVRLARVSIYDVVDGHTLNDVLYGRVTVDARAVDELVVRRTA